MREPWRSGVSELKRKTPKLRHDMMPTDPYGEWQVVGRSEDVESIERAFVRCSMQANRCSCTRARARTCLVFMTAKPSRG